MQPSSKFFNQDQQMIAHRYQYFLWTTLFVAVLSAGEWYGLSQRAWMSPTTFYIWVGACGMLLLFGLLTWIYYLYLIIKHF